jgi:ribose transport system permease protein
MHRTAGIALLLLLLCTAGALFHPAFLSAGNLQNLAQLVGMFGISALGIGLVILTGGIELSIGSMFALIGVLLATALGTWRWSPWLAVPAVLAVPVLLGAGHGWLIVRLRLQPFLVTLCGLLLYRGAARWFAGDETRGFGTGAGFEGLVALATGRVFGVPAPFLCLLAIAALLGVGVHRSVPGRWLFATGDNEAAARLAGIPTDRVLVGAYAVCGLTTGVAAILFAFYTNSIQPGTFGAFYELYGIAAAVLGGCRLTGGAGSVPGVLFGTAVIVVIQNLVNLFGIPSALNYAVLGAVILLAVILDRCFGPARA